MSHGPLTSAMYYILLALAAGRTHGYAMMGYVEMVSEGREQLPAGTLYRTLARLAADGLIVESEYRDGSAPQDAQRRYYRLTPAGRAAVRDEAQRLERLVAAAAEAGVLPASGVA